MWEGDKAGKEEEQEEGENTYRAGWIILIQLVIVGVWGGGEEGGGRGGEAEYGENNLLDVYSGREGGFAGWKHLQNLHYSVR